MNKEDRALIEELADKVGAVKIENCNFTLDTSDDKAVINAIQLMQTQADNASSLLRLLGVGTNSPMINITSSALENTGLSNGTSSD